MKNISDYLALPITYIGNLSATLFNVSISKLVNIELGKKQPSGDMNLGAGVLIGFGIGISTYALLSHCLSAQNCLSPETNETNNFEKNNELAILKKGSYNRREIGQAGVAITGGTFKGGTYRGTFMNSSGARGTVIGGDAKIGGTTVIRGHSIHTKPVDDVSNTALAITEEDLITYFFEKIRKLPFPKERVVKYGGGHVLNYVFSFENNDIMNNNEHYGHQGTPSHIIHQCDELLTNFFKQNADEIRNHIMEGLPNEFKLNWIGLRIIFNINANIECLQSVDGEINTPEEPLSLSILMDHGLEELGYTIVPHNNAESYRNSSNR